MGCPIARPASISTVPAWRSPPAVLRPGWVASPYVNLPQLLLDTLNITPEGGKPTQYPDFEALCAAFRERLNGHMRECIIEQNRIQAERTHFSGDPLVSCFVNDCLSKGVDIEQGGARYNWIMPSFVGMANLADALFAIKTLVYDRKEIDLDTLAQALQQNFKGFEALRGKILNRVAKYGNDDDEADAMVLKIVDWLQASISGYKSYRGGRFIPSMFCWIMHDEFGKCTMATPDGRTAGLYFGGWLRPGPGTRKEWPHGLHPVLHQVGPRSLYRRHRGEHEVRKADVQ